jgi:hypothetical protein
MKGKCQNTKAKEKRKREKCASDGEKSDGM